MASPAGWKSVLMNALLALLGLGLLVLLYAFVVGSFWNGRVVPTREQNPAGLVGDILQVEVRNGCGAAGVAGQFTHFLRARGFDVVEVGNYSRFDVARSQVIDRVGDPVAARRVAEALGIDPAYVVEEVQGGYFLDATIVIGHDYATLAPFAER